MLSRVHLGHTMLKYNVLRIGIPPSPSRVRHGKEVISPVADVR